jgi:hypothetical protein
MPHGLADQIGRAGEHVTPIPSELEKGAENNVRAGSIGGERVMKLTRINRCPPSRPQTMLTVLTQTQTPITIDIWTEEEGGGTMSSGCHRPLKDNVDSASNHRSPACDEGRAHPVT